MARHIKILSMIFLFYGGVLVLEAFGNIISFGNFNKAVIIQNGQIQLANFSFGGFEPFVRILMFVETYFALLVGIPALIGGYGLYHRKAWGRYTLLILSLFLLLKFPIGTFIGLYALWALTKPETVELIHARELL